MGKEPMAETSTLSLKDAQRCFDKERRSLLRDLETLRQQLVKKDQGAARAAAAASAHTIQLKREIAAMQTAMATVEAERTKFQKQFAHTSSLLETALDQKQEDQTKQSRLSEKLRSLEKKHEETLTLVKNEAAANVRATQDERQALRARVEQLRGKIDTERKEWQNTHRPLADELQKCKTRLQLVDKELQDARYRERSSFQLKEKMAAEVTIQKRKVADLSTALQEALHNKSELKAEHSLMIKQMKDKWKEVLRSHQHSKEQLLMLQEDYNGLFRSRTLVEEQTAQLYQSMKHMKARHEQVLKAKETECWEIEKKYKKMSVTCSQCLKTPEQKQQEELGKFDAVREQTRLEVTKTLELERWDRFQDVNSKYIDACQQLQSAVEECDQWRSKCKSATKQQQELQEAEKSLSAALKEAQSQIRELSSKRDQEAEQLEGTKKTIQDLVENLTSLTAVTADQSKKLHEVETAWSEEREHLTEEIRSIDAEKQSLTQELEQLTKRYEEFVAQYELLKQEKSKHWNEIVEAQLSANLLIEEQAHTIDDLLQVKANSTCVSSSQLKLAASSGPPDSPTSCDTARPVGSSRSQEAFRQECELLREEVARLQAKVREQGDVDQQEGDLLCKINALEVERQRLKKRLEEQALTIHELTLQDEEEEDDESCTCPNDHPKGAFELRSPSYADNCPSPGEQSIISTRRTPPKYQEPEDGYWMPQSERAFNRPRSRSPFKNDVSKTASVGSSFFR